MTNWTVLNNAIRQVIYSNGTRDITGQILQTALLNIVNSVGSLPAFGGTATPSTNPGVHDGPVFYIATAEGMYANFNNIAITKSEVPSVLIRTDGTWTKQVIGTALAADIEALVTSLSTEVSRAQAKEAELQGAVEDVKNTIDGTEEQVLSISDAYNTKMRYISTEGACVGGSSNYTIYMFRCLPGYSRVSAFVGATKNSDINAISFYDTELTGSDAEFLPAYISGIAFDNSQTIQKTYSAPIPEGTKTIVITNRDTMYDTPTVAIYEQVGGITSEVAKIPTLEGQIGAVEGQIGAVEDIVVGTYTEVADLSDAVEDKLGGITSTGARGGSSNFTNYYIRNDNYSKVSAFVGAETGSAYKAIAFYNSDNILTSDSSYESAYIGGVSFNGVQEQTTYEADVPNDCVIIVVSCRTALYPNPTASLLELHGGLERQVSNKVDKVAGKGLSTNDFTDKDKSALYGIENYDDVVAKAGTGSSGTWAYSYKTFKAGQKVRVTMYTPTGLTLPEGVSLSQTCLQVAYKTKNGVTKQNLLVRQGYDYPIREGVITSGVIAIEDGDTEFIRMYARCAATEEFGFTIQAIEDNAINKCYAPSVMVPKFNALSFDSIYTHGRVGTFTFNFLHFSDIHKNEVELKRIHDFSALYQSYLCDVINTGDSVQGLGTEDFSWYAENGSKFLSVIGNHDSATSQSGSGWTGLGKQATYDKYIAPFVANWGVVGSSGNNYYYKDYVSSRNYNSEQTFVKLRLIVLDCMFYDETQNAWLGNTLIDARTNGFDVMIAIHTSPASAEIIPCTYTSLNASIQPAGWSSYSTENAIPVVKDFINDGGKFICWLGGHVHRDTMGKITGDNRQLVALIETCSNNVQDNLDRPYIEGELEYADAFNIIGIDTYRHILKIFKVGYEYDGAMRRKGTFVYDYVNSSVVFNG